MAPHKLTRLKGSQCTRPLALPYLWHLCPTHERQKTQAHGLSVACACGQLNSAWRAHCTLSIAPLPLLLCTGRALGRGLEHRPLHRDDALLEARA